MNNLENTNLNETVATTNGANKYNLRKIDTESIKNNVLMNNTFYAFKKAGNCPICLVIPEVLAITILSIIVAAIFSIVLPSIISIIIFIVLFVYGLIFLRNKNRRAAYERYLESQMIGIYTKDLAVLNFVPENIDYQTIKMIEVSGGSYEDAKYNLIRDAFCSRADGIINVTHSATSSSKISGNTKTGIVTDTSTNVYMQGMAIKLV